MGSILFLFRKSSKSRNYHIILIVIELIYFNIFNHEVHNPGVYAIYPNTRIIFILMNEYI